MSAENATNLEFTNSDETILSKLGIIQSTLECPKKKLQSKVNIKKVGGIASSYNNIHVPSDDSSDDCLFDNTRQRRILQKKSVLRLENTHKLTKWHILCLLSAFLFIGISATSRDLLVFNMDNSSDNLTGFSASYGLAHIIGCFFAGYLFSFLNTFAIFLVILVLLVPFSLLIVWQSTLIPFNWMAFLTGLLLVCIERGGLLMSSMLHNYHRIFFSLYTAMSLGSLIASLLMSNGSSVVVMSEDMRLKAIYSQFKLVVKRDVVGNQSITTANFSATTTPSIITNTSSTSQQPNNRTLNADLDKVVFKSKTEENMIRRKEVEQRQKEKEEKEKLLSTSTTTIPLTTSTNLLSSTTTTHTPSIPTHTTTQPTTFNRNHAIITQSTTNISTTTSVPSTSESMIITNTTALISKMDMMAQLVNNIGPFPSESSVYTGTRAAIYASSITTKIALTLLLSGLLVPLLITLYCCRLNNYCLPDIRLLNVLSKAKERTVLDTEPSACKALSSLVWIIHAVFESLLLVCLPICSEELMRGQSRDSQAVLINILLWFPATIVRLFFVIRPLLDGSSSSVIHLFYCTSIFFHLILHFFMPISETRTMVTVLVAGLFLFSLPFFVYNWLNVFLEANPLHLSGRLLVSQAIGRMLGTYIFNWSTSKTSALAPQSIGNLFNSILGLLFVVYALFIWLSTSAHKAKRQMQILQLSEAINGNQLASSEPKARKTNGQYKALLKNEDASNEEEDREDMGFVLTDGSESDRSFV